MNASDKKIVQKVIDGTSSKENARYVAEWFASSIEGQQTLSDMIDRDAYLLEDGLLNKTAISSVKSDLIFSKINKRIRSKQILRLSLRAAAVIIPFVILLGLGLYLNRQVDIFGKSSYAEIYIPKGESGTRLMFQDGSEVYLNADTRIRYPKKFGLSNRNVYLQGEAYFNISSNKNRPFFVHTENTHVKVLGTSFNVKAYANDDDICVTLDKGIVTFNTIRTQYSIPSGHEIVYNKTNKESFVRSLPESSVMSLWKEDVIYLKDTPLIEALQMLERRYNVSFTIKDPKALNYTYTITTKKTSVDEILLELQKISPVRFVRQKDSIDVTLFAKK